MRRALDWLVVDEGGRAAGVVPFTGGGNRAPVQPDHRGLPDVCVRVMDALRGRAARSDRADRADRDDADASLGDYAAG